MDRIPRDKTGFELTWTPSTAQILYKLYKNY